MSLEDERRKYIEAYKLPNYRMGDQRKNAALSDLNWAIALGCRSLLDVGCGRGEMLDAGKAAGMSVAGTEIVPQLFKHRADVYECDALKVAAHFGPQSFELVTCFDVLEHLPVGDEIEVLRELETVTSRCVVVTANNKPSRNGEDDLHINIRPYDEWDRLIRSVFYRFTVTRINDTYSPTWRASLL